MILFAFFVFRHVFVRNGIYTRHNDGRHYLRRFVNATPPVERVVNTKKGYIDERQKNYPGCRSFRRYW